MSDRDPAVRTWGDAIEAGLSTSATARRLEAELDELHRQYNAVLAELGEVRAAADRETQWLEFTRGELRRALQFSERCVLERDQALAEVKRLREATGG